MITTTHIVTNALIAAKRKGGVTSALEGSTAKWFVLGGLAPDVGLYALTAGAAVYFPLTSDMSVQDALQYAFSDLFFNDTAWIAIHNSLHSPVVLLGLAAASYVANKRGALAFVAGALLHTAMDIPVHYDDGPLVFFPFNWDFRVQSPVSYYDRDHFGSFVAPIDFAITIIGGAGLVATWWKSRK